MSETSVVLAPAHPLAARRTRPAALATRAGAVAATSFLAGAAAFAMAQRGGRRRRTRAPILSSHAFLVEIHLLDRK